MTISRRRFLQCLAAVPVAAVVAPKLMPDVRWGSAQHDIIYHDDHHDSARFIPGIWSDKMIEQFYEPTILASLTT